LDNSATGVAQFDQSYSNPATLDAYSLRIDQRLNGKLMLFGRYNYSPSNLTQRGNNGAPLSDILRSQITTQTGTLGVTWALSTHASNDLRFNYSRASGTSNWQLDSFEALCHLLRCLYRALHEPECLSGILDFAVGEINVGVQGNNVQRQINLVDNQSVLLDPMT